MNRANCLGRAHRELERDGRTGELERPYGEAPRLHDEAEATTKASVEQARRLLEERVEAAQVLKACVEREAGVEAGQIHVENTAGIGCVEVGLEDTSGD